MSRLPDPANARLRDFLRAAAVLWQFDPGTLEPDSDERAGRGEAAALLMPFVARLRGAGHDRWTLRDALRPEHLRGADLAELARLRARNAATNSREQEIVDRWLAGPDPALAEYDFEALAILSRISTWFEPVPPHFPAIDRLDRLRALARVREPLLELAGKGLRGRASELARLHRFVAGALTGAPAILVVHGIGGAGKSALTAQFLLDVLASGDPSHLVAYLDFDHPTLDLGDGMTLMLEILSQAATQLPGNECLHSLVRRASQATVDLSAGRGVGPGRTFAMRASMEELASYGGRVLRAAGASKLTLVLDTFEDIQYANLDHRRQLVEQLGILHARLPGLHTIVVSRAMIGLPGAEQLEVKDLTSDAARLMLADHGVHGEALVHATLHAVRGNPLSLKLAAAALEKSTVVEPHDPGRLDALEHALVHGQLYQRIVAHVHEAEIQQLAHPGLVVRRVTPPVLQRVLAEPCGLGAIDARRASELFAQLAREVSLVRPAEDGALEHRADVRRVMLRLIYHDRPVIARQLHERAADYYRDRTDAIAIVEEAYHRFALGETGGPWLLRLTPACAARLYPVLDELPESAWPIIILCAGFELSAERRQAVQTAVLERHLAQRVSELLRAGRVEQALALIEPLSPRGRSSVLWRWRGRALWRVGRLSEALVALERALATLAGPDGEAREDLALARAVAEQLGDQQSLSRLASVMSPAAPGPLGPPRAVQALARGTRPEAVQDAPDSVHWLDDQDLHSVLEAALDLPQPLASDACPEACGPGTNGVEAASVRSTRAASAYAKAVTLNRRVEGQDTGADLFDWVDTLSKSHRGLEAIRGNLKLRLSLK